MNIEFNKNEDAIKLKIAEMNRRLSEIRLGGGRKKIEKEHSKGKLSARERIDYLIDQNSNFIEIGAFVGNDMYKEYGGCPAGGVVMGIGYVSSRQCIIVANDATVKAGAWFPISAKVIATLLDAPRQDPAVPIGESQTAGRHDWKRRR